MLGERLYQKILDRQDETKLDADAVAQKCLFTDEEELAFCFGDLPGAAPTNLHEHLTRRRLLAIAKFVKLPVFTIFVLADGIHPADVFIPEDLPRDEALGLMASAITDIMRSPIAGASHFIIEQYVKASFARSLNEACVKNHQNYHLLLGWRNGTIPPELKHLELIRELASVCEMMPTLVMAGLGLIREADFTHEGRKWDVRLQLEIATTVKPW